MIPSTTGFLGQDFEFEEQPTYTYKMNLDTGTIRGYTDGLDAMRQAIFKILQTERYQYVMYSWNYGVETLDLYGEPVSYVCPELERRITEALTWDERIKSVNNFEFDVIGKGAIHVSFVAHTVFGEVQAETKVNF
ncbi:MAG: Protein of unknown function (DUF2634) [Bacteriophage sp.]|jgi:phage baseplate assembly protein W|nr:MAG: Protein of unknown function (DUF2634) [Bacteriophage sp.]UVY21706.1 MAG: Protein of unknown function (DUF2634) [Bacteriophage sp.]UVY22540.1 MAG: Protein of unknown function (DUF2634) [Bacteriophage sp.]UVY34356.1 MAG: Protein of unknown function (DUF2634) [Bacteriophage sp.]UWD73583.1 MAG: Protein of unknown function (DUF2634) [Bacteriophage sp.]